MIVYDYFVALLSACTGKQGKDNITRITATMAYLSPLVLISLFFDILHWININFHISVLGLVIAGVIVTFVSYDFLLKINLIRYKQIDILSLKISKVLSFIFLVIMCLLAALFFGLSIKNILHIQ